MKRILFTIFFIVAASFVTLGRARTSISKPHAAPLTLAERLGYRRDAKLLIVHVDDLGMAHSVNSAAMKAFESGLVSSGSIMVPCPWFAEIAAYARSHPQADLGLHLTLTSEWANYRWGPVLSKDRVASLLDQSGYLYATETLAAAHIKTQEAEAEIRAQIERARSFGIQPTHLDSHMGTLYQNKNLFEMLLRVARDNHLPVLIPKERLTGAQDFSALLQPGDVLIDRLIEIGPDVPPEGWAKFYTERVKSLQPGVTQIVVHLAYDDEEMRGATFDHPDWGAGWRQRDFQFFTSEAFRSLLHENNINLVTWREISRLSATSKGAARQSHR
ncbi:MAG TPA: polysaccharide deacetylase family protein [Pyrinomonadaceae bacterium]|jgi:predicted glycoside hydrolase/deacetylase ChbG (UPF0249 family)|nr:polysaccharide deacetylase family protein [Pyrinomonadaceae bacterium]